MNCIYCYSNGGDIKQSITLEKAKKLIDFYSNIINHYDKKKYFSKILIFSSSGEPTLKFNEMKSITSYAKSKINGIKIHVDSNGLFSNDVLKWSIKNLDSIGISLDGPSEIQSKTRPSGIKNSIRIIENNIKSILKYNKKLTINSVFTKYSYGKELEIIRYFLDLGVRNIFIGPLEKEGRCTDKLYKELKLSDKDFFKSFIKIKELGDIFKFNISTKPLAFSNPNIINYCSANTLALLPTNEISICSKYTNINEPILYKNLIIGSIKKDSVKLSDEKIQRINNRIKNYSKCLSCDYFFLCGGGCPLRNLKENKDINIPDERHCNFLKGFYKIYFFYLTQRYLIKKKPYFLRENDGLHFSTIYSDFKLSENSIVKSSLIILNKNSNFDDIKEKIINEWNSNPKDFLIFFISVREKKEKIGNKILNFLDELSKKNIPFIISRPIPRCLFYSFDDFEKLKKFNNPESIYNSFEFYEVQNNGKIKFFDGSYGKNIEEYEDRNDIKNDFLNKKHDFIPDECKKCIYFKNDLCKMYNL